MAKPAHREEGFNGEPPEEGETGSVGEGGGDGSEREEGGGQVHLLDNCLHKCQDDGGGEANRHKQADGEDGEQGEGDVDQHVRDDDGHHLVLKVVSGKQPDKDSSVKLLGSWWWKVLVAKCKEATCALMRASISSNKSIPSEVV